MNRALWLVLTVTLWGCQNDVQPTAANNPRASSANTAPRQGDNVVTIGQTIRLGSLEITPQKVELRSVRWRPKLSLDKELRETKPVIVVTIAVKNISEGQVFKPLVQVEGRDNFGNQLRSPFPNLELPVVEGSQDLADLKPGGEATVLICLEPKIDTAKTYLCKVRSNASNAEDSWRDWTLRVEGTQVTPQGSR